MAEYIEREAIKYETWAVSPADRSPLMVVRKRNVDKIPAADVEPVRHGRWKTLTGNPTPRCTSCHKEAVKLWHGGWYTPDRCPNCGAKMDGEV